MKVESATTLTYSIDGGKKQSMVDITAGQQDLVIKKDGRLRVVSFSRRAIGPRGDLLEQTNTVKPLTLDLMKTTDLVL